jgi:hypothetical protein
MSRVRGFAPWTPRAKSQELLEQVEAVFEQYEEQLPLTIRQVFYRLVATVEFEKTENGYERLQNLLNRARRASLISFEDIRDDGVTIAMPLAFAGRKAFFRAAKELAARYARPRQDGQEQYIELWVEAAGMVPLIKRTVGDEFGIPIQSCGGFDSTSAKWGAAQRALARDVPTVVMHIGDHDPSGLALFESVGEDVGAMVAEFDGDIDFRRIAVTPEQIDRYQLPTAPPKKNDVRSAWTGGGTVQAEALPPDVLGEEVRQAVSPLFDDQALAEIRAQEKVDAANLNADLERWADEGDGGPA